MTCCLCRKPLLRAVHETRGTGLGGRPQSWDYCRRCWKETLRQKEYLAAEPTHRSSTLVMGGALRLIHVKSFHQENVA